MFQVLTNVLYNITMISSAIKLFQLLRFWLSFVHREIQYICLFFVHSSAVLHQLENLQKQQQRKQLGKETEHTFHNNLYKHSWCTKYESQEWYHYLYRPLTVSGYNYIGSLFKQNTRRKKVYKLKTKKMYQCHKKRWHWHIFLRSQFSTMSFVFVHLHIRNNNNDTFARLVHTYTDIDREKITSFVCI